MAKLKFCTRKHWLNKFQLNKIFLTFICHSDITDSAGEVRYHGTLKLALRIKPTYCFDTVLLNKSGKSIFGVTKIS